MRPLCCSIALLAALAAPAGATTFAAMGDSLTDEYLGSPATFGATDLPALSWVQILAEKRGLDFGAFESDGAVRGEPRAEGYANNWARSGSVAAPPGIFSIPTLAPQVAGLAPTVASGAVDVVYLGIGSNDFFVRELLTDRDGLPFLGPDFTAWRDERLDAVFGAIDTLLAAANGAGTDLDIILAELPPGTAAGTNPDVLTGIADYNAELTARAAGYGIVPVDMWAFTQDPARVDADGTLHVGGFAVPGGSRATLAQTVPIGAGGARPCDSAGRCATLAYALNFIASDGIHPNTIVQGLLANEFIRAVNDRRGTNIAPLSDDEIIAAAVPEPGTGTLLLLGLALITHHRRR